MAKHKAAPNLDDRFLAAVDLIRRTGADQFQIRYCEEESPVIWIAGGQWGDKWVFGAALEPLEAIFRLCESAVDGGTCIHCGKLTGFVITPEQMPASKLVCWYQYDPELKTFRRACE